MTLPVVPGSSMSFSQINTELSLTSTATISLNDTAVRNLAGVGANPAQIAITNLSGKSNVFALTISSNQTNANLRSLAVSAGWNQTAPVSATLNSSTYIYSTSTGTAGLTIDGSWPGGVTLVNNGFIMGMGGSGGTPSSAGGPAISLGVNCTITNNSYIGGGGGSGGASGVNGNSGQNGGGAGGGDGGFGTAGGLVFAAGGAGGGPGSAGSNGNVCSYSYKGGTSYGYSAGGGGRIMPGTGGAYGGAGSVGSGGGAGGGGCTSSSYAAGSGGSGGSAGGNATPQGTAGNAGGGGGGWGASGGTGYCNGVGRGGGAGGKAIALNGFTVTQNGSGTTYGAVS